MIDIDGGWVVGKLRSPEPELDKAGEGLLGELSRPSCLSRNLHNTFQCRTWICPRSARTRRCAHLGSSRVTRCHALRKGRLDERCGRDVRGLRDK